MTWNAYFLKYRLASPIHIGDLALGNVQKTVFFIPGKTLWGAATAILAYAHFQSPSSQDYQAVGEYIRQAVRFGYFFLEDESDRYVPILTASGLRYGLKLKLTQEETENLFLYSEASTAIIKNKFVAEPSTLHETEYIWPQNRNGQSGAKTVYFSGYVYLCREKSDIINFPDDLSILHHFTTLFVGANRRMGNGRLVLATELNNTQPETKDGDLPGPAQKDILYCDRASNNFLLVSETNGENYVAASHLIYDRKISNGSATGIVQPLVEREWEQGRNGVFGAGQKISDAVIAWEPGSIIHSCQSVRVGDFGRWQFI